MLIQKEIIMFRLAKYIEHEFDRNIIFFSQAYSRAEASLDFICYIMDDKKLINLTEEEQRYINQIKSSYAQIASLTDKIAEEIQKYKEYYQDFLLSEGYDD